MTQIFAFAPQMFRDFTIGVEDEKEQLISDFVDGDIGKRIKLVLLDEFKKLDHNIFEDLENTRLEALSGYATVQAGLRNITKDTDVANSISELYGSIVSSNFRFALKILLTLVQILTIAVQQNITEEYDVTHKNFVRMKRDLERIVSKSGFKMPDSPSFKEIDEEYSKLFSEFIVGYNIALFMVLVIVVATITKRKITLKKEQINQLEVILRDWPQEVMAQLSVMNESGQSSEILFELQGIIPDQDDFDIVNEGLTDLNDDLE